MNLQSLIPRFAQMSNDAALIMEAMPDADGCRRIVWCNEAVSRDTGYAALELVDGTPSIFFGENTSPESRDDLTQGLAAQKAFRVDMVVYRKDGSFYWSELSLTPVPDDEGILAYWIIFVRDVSDKMSLLESAEGAARHAQHRLWSAIEALPEAFVLFDAEDRLVLFNEPYRSIYESSGAKLKMGETFETLIREGQEKGLFPEAEGREEEWIAQRLDEHNNPKASKIKRLPGDRYFKVQEYKTPAGDTVGLRHDVTVIVRQGQKLREQAKVLEETMAELDQASRTDALTGLGNRRGLDLELDELRARTDPQTGLAFLHIDLDRFKPINDVFGHAAGDHVLKVVGEILAGSIRSEDFVARVGGDEFAVILGEAPKADLEDVATRVAERIIEACSKPVKWRENRLLFGTSIGIAIGQIKDVDRLMQDADIALYQAKDNGRSQLALFTPALRKRVEHRKRLADKFQHGMEHGEVLAYYQPQIDSQSGDIVGVEALVRWEHPTDGLIQPSEFLPIAEDLGLMAEVDDLVLRHALVTAENCAKAGVALPKVSVNISYSRIKKLHDLSGLRSLQPWPCNLAFELLEAIDFDDDDNRFAWTMDNLREMGVSIEIDDFGSGRASLTTLLKIRPDRIKIDRRIVSEALSTNDGADAMIRAIGEMARGLGIEMTAEGIETEVQAAHMRDMGCDVLQGFLYSPALPCAELIRWMKARVGSDEVATKKA